MNLTSRQRSGRGVVVETFTIGQLAARTRLSVSAIRFYQRRGLLPARQPVSGWQRCGPDTLTRLGVIELAKRCGFTLDEVAELLGAMDPATDASPAPTWKAMAEAKLAEIDAQGRRLHHMRALLTDALACSCLDLDRAQLIPAALDWVTQATSTTQLRDDAGTAHAASR